MKRLYVFADFDWLKEPRLIGELSYESLRGSDSYGFCYNDEWLKSLMRSPVRQANNDARFSTSTLQRVAASFLISSISRKLILDSSQSMDSRWSLIFSWSNPSLFYIRYRSQ